MYVFDDDFELLILLLLPLKSWDYGHSPPHRLFLYLLEELVYINNPFEMSKQDDWFKFKADLVYRVSSQAGSYGYILRPILRD